MTMAQDYNMWLAERVLNEHQLINYRNLSRAMKVHSNRAKQMLSEFHRKQNSKHGGSVHATYLITGSKPRSTRAILKKDVDGDEVMQSSPWLSNPSSSAAEPEDVPEIVAKSIMLVREEHLDDAKALLEHVSSIHIYSLQAHGLSQIQTLTDCNRRVATEYAREDPLLEWKTYGSIQNADVRRRTTKGIPPPAPVPIAQSKPVANASVKEQMQSGPAAKPTSTRMGPEPAKSANASNDKSATGKNQNSALFRSFAKSSTKSKKAEVSQASNATDSQGSSAQTPAEDELMGGFSDDDEQDDASLPEELAEVKVPEGKSKKDREAELQAMMDEEDDDQDMTDANVHAPDAEESVEEATKADSSAQNEDQGSTEVVENGRRRGRRRIMKKKTVRDEEGYLVTKEEPAWESFSEDEEPAAKKVKMQPASKASAPATKKAGSGKSQTGNIMSFFSKK